MYVKIEWQRQDEYMRVHFQGSDLYLQGFVME